MSIVYFVDVYGPDARSSAAADYVELLALKGRKITLADIADFIKDDDARLLTRERYVEGIAEEELEGPAPGTDIFGGDPQGAAIEAAQRVINLVDQRGRILGEHYPFKLTDSSVVAVRDSLDVTHNAYIALLSVTSAHAYGVDAGLSITEAFESTVARVMQRRIPRSVAFSELCRKHGFSGAVGVANTALMLSMDVDGVVINTAIQDGGGDAMAHLDWNDGRPGRWTFVGQVTCGRSDSWESKAYEAARGFWHQLIGDWIKPSPFLAVPHHVEDIFLSRLVQDSGVMLLDRLRLAPYLGSLSTSETTIIDSVLSSEVEYL